MLDRVSGILAAIGLVAGLGVHALTYRTAPAEMDCLAWQLHVGVFVVFIPAVWKTGGTTRVRANERLQVRAVSAVSAVLYGAAAQIL